MAKGDVNFAPHVNHQVRVTGTMMGRGMAQNQTGAPNRPEAGTPNQGNRGDAPTAASAGAMAAMFHVTELTMVSATCEAK